MSKQQKKPKQTFEGYHARDFDELQEKCYKELHRPCVVKVRGFKDKIWYICKKDLDEYMKEHKEIDSLVVAFER